MRKNSASFPYWTILLNWC